jgi:hypothetical protein
VYLLICVFAVCCWVYDKLHRIHFKLGSASLRMECNGMKQSRIGITKQTIEIQFVRLILCHSGLLRSARNDALPNCPLNLRIFVFIISTFTCKIALLVQFVIHPIYFVKKKIVSLHLVKNLCKLVFINRE